MYLLFVKSPVYVTTMLATCGSLFVAVGFSTLVIVLLGSEYCNVVIFEIVSLIPVSTHVELVVPTPSV
jgi:mannose/fructose/N-acetylgalactosamine-specific phosphotransferase system component IIC